MESWAQEEDRGLNKLSRLEGVILNKKELLARNNDEKKQKHDIEILNFIQKRCQTLIALDAVFTEYPSENEQLVNAIKGLLKNKDKYDIPPDSQQGYVDELDSIWKMHYLWFALKFVVCAALIIVGSYVSCCFVASTTGLSLLGLIPVLALIYGFGSVIANSREFVDKIAVVRGGLDKLSDDDATLRAEFIGTGEEDPSLRQEVTGFSRTT